MEERSRFAYIPHQYSTLTHLLDRDRGKFFLARSVPPDIVALATLKPICAKTHEVVTTKRRETDKRWSIHPLSTPDQAASSCKR